MNLLNRILLLVLISAAVACGDERPPNVIIIMADDLGYHDVGCYGHPEINTPVIDQLAKDGVRLTSFYAGATVCTPSRMALLTGAYPSRLGWEKGVVGYLMKKGEGLSPDALTMAEIFKASGYRTGISGKWHLGNEGPFLPQNQGFDDCFYIKMSNNQTDELWRGDERVEKPFDNRLLTEKFTSEAIRFIEATEDKPFFLYVPYTAPHFPVQAHPDWKGKSSYGVYGDVVEELDARIGEILKCLDENEITENTIVVFLSDNGPEPGTRASKADPLRGRKWSALEGGTRVPCVVRWPGKVRAGRESSDLVAAIDLLPSLCHACGINLGELSEDKPPIDGIDVWESLSGKDVDHPRNQLLYWHGRDGFQAIRVGSWKLFPDGKGVRNKENTSAGPALFNLDDDIGETNDVSEKFPEKVREMRELAAEQIADIESEILPLGKE